MKNDRRQIGARHIARARGAFRGQHVRPVKKVKVMTKPEGVGATQAACAPTERIGLAVPGLFRDLSGEAAAAGWNSAPTAGSQL